MVMCLYPKLINNPKYKSNKKNKGIIPTISDERVKLVPVGCGNCIECRKQKARGWQVRLLEDIKTNKNGKFITLTFSDESVLELSKHKKCQGLQGYYLDNEIATLGVRMFLERWRQKYGKSLRHWLVTELGHNGTENIHIHGIIWSERSFKDIKEKWQYGYVYPSEEENIKTNYVNERTVNYIIKYITKTDEKHKEYRSKILTSAGIGNNYTQTYNAKNNRFQEQKTEETYRTSTGHKISMPIYWRNKIYNDEEREKLWLQKLDKNERWIMGEKIAADNLEEIDTLTKYYRKINKQLGYGSDERNEERIWYEQKRRALLNETRKAKAIAKKRKASGRG